jgi:hypothetical protein
MPMNPFVAAIVAVGAVGLALLYFRTLRPVGGNLLVNGSFETGHFVPSNSVMPLKNAATDIEGWVTIGPVLWSNEANTQVGKAQDGSLFLDLANRAEHGPHGGLKQSILLGFNSDYRLAYFISNPPGFPGPVTVSVSIASGLGVMISKDFTSNPGGAPWQRLTMLFETTGWLGTAAGVPATITIQAKSGQRQSFIGIDNVSLHLMRSVLGAFSR